VTPTASVTPDAANERLLIVADPKDHVTIATTLDKLTRDIAEDGVTLKSYDAKGVTYSSVVPLLKVLAPRARLIDESAKRRLLALASVEDHEQISNVLEQVREDPDTQRPSLKAFPLPDNVVA
jgi:chorismate mutase